MRSRSVREYRVGVCFADAWFALESLCDKFCAAQNYLHAGVLSALIIAQQGRYSRDLRNCSIGAWLLT
jgi:hypothetical protein